jgi:hypothetical protein
MKKCKSFSLPAVATILLSHLLIAEPIHGKELWLRCPDREGYLIGLSDKTKTYSLNDWFFINQSGQLKIGGDWFHGTASFTPHHIELLFSPTMEYKGKKLTWMKRLVISRIDLSLTEFYREKINNGDWSKENTSNYTRGKCVVAKDPGIKQKI